MLDSFHEFLAIENRIQKLSLICKIPVDIDFAGGLPFLAINCKASIWSSITLIYSQMLDPPAQNTFVPIRHV